VDPEVLQDEALRDPELKNLESLAE
jgi:hypothetical protein